MIEFIFLFIACVVLAKSGEHDYKTMYVRWFTPLLIIICGISYMLVSGNNIMDTIGIVILTGFIFALPSLFSFGLGDFLIFIGLAFFIDTEQGLWMFLGIFLVIWLMWTGILIKKLKQQNKKFWKVEYPLVPVIAFSFYGWIIQRLIM